MKLAATLAFAWLLATAGNPSFADSSDLFEPSKMSTEGLALGIETCVGKTKGDKRQELITRHYCACMMDASQVLSPEQKLTKEQAQKCLAHATQAVEGYLQGKTDQHEQNLFDSGVLPSSTIYTMYLVCRKRSVSKTRHCGCLIDGVRTDPSFTPDQFISGSKPLRSEWIKMCSGADPGSTALSQSKR